MIYLSMIFPIKLGPSNPQVELMITMMKTAINKPLCSSTNFQIRMSVLLPIACTGPFSFYPRFIIFFFKNRFIAKWFFEYCPSFIDATCSSLGFRDFLVKLATFHQFVMCTVANNFPSSKIRIVSAPFAVRIFCVTTSIVASVPFKRIP